MRTLHIAIALVIHSLDRSLQEINPKGWCAVRTLHIAIALAIHSLDRSLQEINPKGWCAVRTLHIAIALAFDRSLQEIAGAQCAP